MLQVLCPHCGEPLRQEKNVFCCGQGHSFDVARQGYVNLLPVQQKHSLHPGDTREMVAARRRFLEAGHYLPIARTLAALVQTWAPAARRVLDAGCGEGYYLSHLDFIPSRCGIDISKEAVRYAAGRDKGALWLTATAAHLPFPEGSFDCLTSMFALTVAPEFARVLAPGGVFVEVVTGPEHLMALRGIIYPEVQRKEKEAEAALEGFALRESRMIGFDFSLEGPEAVRDLLYMTPHVWRISQAGAAALEQTQRLEDRAQVLFRVYQKLG
ncbi:MAG: methyltransferase domain-containing protein [Oscillospiraceae bacterium]|nr:methyltransferase domain-containing protein [Oscillospiraceae bacterium]